MFRAQSLTPARTFLTRNQAQVTRNLLAPREAMDIPDRQHKGQRCVRTDSRLRHQQSGLGMVLRRLRDRSIQLPDLLVQHGQQSQ